MEAGSVESLFKCFVLSVSSSLDNFAVGTSLGVAQNPLSIKLNAIVSFCNAVGALCSSEVGAFLGSMAPSIACLSAAAVFGWLGICEAASFRKDEASPLSSLAAAGVAWRLALPMTLNNLAGGVAGGLAGVHSLTMGFGAALASFFMMYLGYWLGRLGAEALKSSCFDPRAGAAIAFLTLAANQVASSAGWMTGLCVLCFSLLSLRVGITDVARSEKEFEFLDVLEKQSPRNLALDGWVHGMSMIV